MHYDHASEPHAPLIRTTVPGPKTNAIRQDLDNVFDARTIQMVIDYEKSSGV
jgi:4-aminobutyrate aminotransferase/(S)-3-amino-2-methylpropionate transaminase